MVSCCIKIQSMQCLHEWGSAIHANRVSEWSFSETYASVKMSLQTVKQYVDTENLQAARRGKYYTRKTAV